MNKEILDQISKEDLIKLLFELKKEDEEKIGIIELCDEYLAHLTNIGREKSTLKTYRFIIDRWILWTAQEKIEYAHEVKRRHTNIFYSELNKLSEFTRIACYKRLKAMFNYALDMGYIGKNPFYLKLQFPTRIHNKYWTEEYFAQLTQAIRKYAKHYRKFQYEMITRILFTTGIRIGKLVEMTKDDIRINENEILLNTSRKNMNKNSVQNHVFHVRNKRAIEMLKLHMERTESEKMLFPYANPYSHYISYRKAIETVCKKAGIPYLSPHKAKHGYITMLAKKGITAEQVCRLTGNVKVELVQKTYTHFNTKELVDKTEYIVKDL